MVLCLYVNSLFTIDSWVWGSWLIFHFQGHFRNKKNLGRQPSHGQFQQQWLRIAQPATTNTLSWCRLEPSKGTYLCQMKMLAFEFHLVHLTLKYFSLENESTWKASHETALHLPSSLDFNNRFSRVQAVGFPAIPEPSYFLYSISSVCHTSRAK